MKNGPSFTEKLINNASNVGLLATSLLSAPYMRDLFTTAVEQTVGRPNTPQTYIPYVIAREAVGYLATPLIVKAGLQMAHKAISFCANKAKSWFWKEDKASSAAVALRASAPIKTAPQKDKSPSTAVAIRPPAPVIRSTPAAIIEKTPQQRLQQLLDANPAAQMIVNENLALAQTKLFNHNRLADLVSGVEKFQPKQQVDFIVKFLNKN